MAAVDDINAILTQLTTVHTNLTTIYNTVGDTPAVESQLQSFIPALEAVLEAETVLLNQLSSPQQ